MRCLLLLTFLSSPALAAQEPAPPNFADHVAPLLRENCLSCHKGSRARNGLDLRTAQGILKGGSSGPAVVPGDPEGSLLYQVMVHAREPYMPPDEPPLETDVTDVIEAWIAGGARANATDTGAPSAPAGPTFVAPPKVGEAVLPEGVSTQPVWWSEHSDTINALAASPTAPLVAVSGHRQVALYRIPEGELMGVLPFPEGEITSLRFAASGAVLVSAGGRGADLGLAVGWDVRSGARVFALGEEPDVALDADVTVDHGLVALGGPDRVVRSYSARSGELLYELTPHTDWVTSVAFSPDGVLLATGDRAGGVFVWEALTGREFHALPAQRGPVTSLSWRADSMLLAIGGDDGRVRSFEMERGGRVREFRVHDGVLAMQLLGSGSGVSAGRDGRARLWREDGKRTEDFEGMTGVVTAVCATFDEQHVVAGDFAGNVHVYSVSDGKQPIRALRPNPRTDEERAIPASEAALPVLEAAAEALDQAVTSATERLTSAGEALTAATAAAEPVLSRVAPARAALDGARSALAGAEAALARYTGPQAEKDVQVEQLLDRARALELLATEARSRVDEALSRSVRAEEATLLAADDAGRAVLQEAQDVAEQLLAGALAQAQLAAAHAAEARLAGEVARVTAESWREVSAPSRTALARARDEEQARAEELRRFEGEARVAEEALQQATGEEVAARDALGSVREGAAEARRSVETGRQAIVDARAAWDDLHEKLIASGGLVPQAPGEGPGTLR